MSPPGSRLKKAPKPYTMNPTPMGVRMEPKEICRQGQPQSGGFHCHQGDVGAAARWVGLRHSPSFLSCRTREFRKMRLSVRTRSMRKLCSST